MKRRWYTTPLVLTLGLSTVLAAGTPRSVVAESYSDEIKQLEQKQQQVNEEIAQSKKKLAAVEERQQSLKEQIAALEAQVHETLADIRAKEQAIAVTREQIEKLKREIRQLEKKIARRDRILKERIVVMYKNGGALSYLEVLFGAESFGDFLDRVLALNLIAEQDQRILQQQKRDKAAVENKRNRVQQKLKSLEQQLADLEQLKSSLKAQQEEKQKLIAQLEEKEKAIHEHLHEKSEAIEIIKEKISDLIEKREAARRAREAREKAQAQKQSGAVHTLSAPSGGGMFVLPVTTGYISSRYGYRNIGSGTEFHDGWDFAAPVGTPIYAAAAGTVLYAGPASGFGNWIVIDHNNGYYTIYGHMYSNQLYVTEGEFVEQGEKIAAVGSAGRSTGAHLHFEISVGGISNSVNPAQFY